VPEDPAGIAQQLVEMAALARKEGLLSLEGAAKEVTDPFFRRGVELVVDGKDAETIRASLENDLEAAAARHAQRAHIFKQAGGFAPTLGIIGTVVGLVHVMTDISSPQTLGPAIGAAFTATLWGVLSANLVWHPMAAKLQRLSEAEVTTRQAAIEGLLAIQAGERPSVVQSLLAPYMAGGAQELGPTEALGEPAEQAGAA
jgi:chemotaxis protein MotA